MSYKYFLWGMRTLAAVSLVSVVFIILFLSPYQNPESKVVAVSNVVLLEASLLLALFAGFSLLLFWLRRWGKEYLGEREINFMAALSARQGLLLSLLVIVLLIMQSFGVLTWWDGLLAVAAVMMMELYFLAKQQTGK